MTPINAIRVYVETSVFGGAFDDEFRAATSIFFQQVEEGRFVLVTSAVVRDEIQAAPPQVRNLFRRFVADADIVDVTPEALALAATGECQLIVSWNFRHLVHFQKIPLYNAVMEVNGFRPVTIHSPREVIEYER
jgi:hypothetical protein